MPCFDMKALTMQPCRKKRKGIAAVDGFGVVATCGSGVMVAHADGLGSSHIRESAPMLGPVPIAVREPG